MNSEKLFELNFSNIPTVNLRSEFNHTYAYIFSDAAATALKPPIQAIEAPMFVWLGMPDDLMTLLLQRAILGVESYLPAALMHVSAQLGIASKELFAKIHDPFSLGGRTLVANLYHRMPALVHPELSLQYLDQDLYEKNLRFYKSIRNPLFHGKQLHDTNIEALRNAFDHIARIYEWIDYWHNPEQHFEGLSKFAGVRNRHSKMTEP